MRRFKIVGLCLIAVFAVTAFASSAASAALPEFKVCAKAVKVGKTTPTGEFSDKSCTVKAAGGKYLLESGLGKKTAIKTKSKAAILETPGAGTVECKSSKSGGNTAGTKEETGVIVEFKTCTSIGKKCNSPGAKAGTIKTNALHGVLGYLSKSPLKVGIALSPEKSGAFDAEFNCEGLGVQTFGTVIGQVTGDINVISKASVLTLAAPKEGQQEFTNFEGGAKGEDELKTEFNLGSGFGPPGGLSSSQKVISEVKGEALMIAA
jgi:hypothetical protein